MWAGGPIVPLLFQKAGVGCVFNIPLILEVIFCGRKGNEFLILGVNKNFTGGPHSFLISVNFSVLFFLGKYIY